MKSMIHKSLTKKTQVSKQFLPLLFIIISAAVTAQTNITTTTVTGVWTLAGSPYLVQNYINIPAGQSLTIEPGVAVKFVPK